MNKLKFNELQLSRTLQKAIADIGFEETTPIQSEIIPLMLEGKDVIGQAQTGTGKTVAFAIPIIEKIDINLKEIQAIILCPTRELAIQVTEEFRKLLKYKDETIAISVYGGQDINRQFKALKKGPQILVGTPGRTIDHLNRGSIKFNHVKIAILDEADEMLDMGFQDDIEFILQTVPKTRQTAMFSATMPKEFLALTKKYQKDPKFIDVTLHKLSVPKIDQVYFEIPEKSKPEALARLLDLHNIKLALVFCNTKNQVDILVDLLKNRGYFAEGLHGDLTQTKRDKVMQGFRNGTVEVLVATDVAGRGIDVNDIEAVFNYDLPYDDEDYIHRIGRTGRAGKTGKAFTFVVGREIYNLKRIEKTYNIKVAFSQIPSFDDLEETKLFLYINKIKTTIGEGNLNKFVLYIEKILKEDYTAIDIAAALLKIIIFDEYEKFEKTLSFKESLTIVNEDKNKKNRQDRNRKVNRTKKERNFSDGRKVKSDKFSTRKDKGTSSYTARRADGVALSSPYKTQAKASPSNSKKEGFAESKKRKELYNWKEILDDNTRDNIAKSLKQKNKRNRPNKRKRSKY
jgi:ATP-dependent RNA helicase DeaD